jgi:hypothetical protein
VYPRIYTFWKTNPAQMELNNLLSISKKNKKTKNCMGLSKGVYSFYLVGRA